MTTIITYEQIKNSYNEFKKNPPKDSFMKYYKEYSFMKSLIEFATQKGLEKDVFEYTKIKNEAAQHLIDMGYKATIEK